MNKKLPRSLKVLLFGFVIFFSYEIEAAPLYPIPPRPKDVFATTAVDSGTIRIWYALNASDLNKPETYDDLQRLEIGLYLSKYYSHFVYTSDSLGTEWRKKHPKAQSGPGLLGTQYRNYDHWLEYKYSECFKDFTKNVFTEYARMPGYLLRSNSWYSEAISTQNWKIGENTQTVSGHLCQQATCTFRGRNYTAWFALDIPISNGPWKFGGLPGLILKIYDDKKLFIFECIRIENSKNKYPINRYNDYKHYAKINREKLLEFQQKIHADYYRIAGFDIRPEMLPYHPLELE